MKSFKEILMENTSISNEILKQLGGNKFITMTGAKNLVSDSKGLGFRIGKNKSKANYVKIEYDKGKDLYNVIFGSIKNVDYTELKVFKGISVEQLRKVFTDYTGLYTSL